MSEKALFDITNPEITEQVRSLAHQIWNDEGRPEGLAEQHWLAAEAIVRARIETGETENPDWLQPKAVAQELEASDKPVSDIGEIRQRLQGRSVA